MELLFKREQTRNLFGKVVFRLWAMTEMDENQRALIDRYDLDQARLIETDDSEHLKWAITLGIVAFLAVGGVFTMDVGPGAGLVAGLIAGVAVGYFWLNEKRETIYMKDLIHGRRFKCRSIIDLAKKEARLDSACVVLQQVLETAKHWDGVETCLIPVLPKDEAKELIVRLA